MLPGRCRGADGLPPVAPETRAREPYTRPQLQPPRLLAFRDLEKTAADPATSVGRVNIKLVDPLAVEYEDPEQLTTLRFANP